MESKLTASAGLTSQLKPDRAKGARYARSLAWSAVVLCILFTFIDLWLSRLNGTSGTAQLAQVTTVGSALMGGLVASRRPRNPVGWILCAVGVLGAFSSLAWEYGFRAVEVAPSSAPLGIQALWLGDWIWIPAVGIGLPFLAARLPNGHTGTAWRAVDWLAVAGTAALVIATALAPGGLDIRTPARNPFGLDGANGWLFALRWSGYVAVATALSVSVASLLGRLRTARGDEREQIKWIAAAVAIAVIGLGAGFVRLVFFDAPLFSALVPFFVATIAMPFAIAVAVMKFRLYEINLIINRAIVYGTLTAGLAGLYAVSIAVTNFLVGAAGQRSAVAILVTAFIGATAFTPAKEWLHKVVDSRFAVHDPAAEIDALRERINLVINVLDAERIARQVVEDIASKFEPAFVRLSLKKDAELVALHTSQGSLGTPALELHLHGKDQELGVLSIGERRRGLVYTTRDVAALQACADAVAEALTLSATARGALTGTADPEQAAAFSI